MMRRRRRRNPRRAALLADDGEGGPVEQFDMLRFLAIGAIALAFAEPTTLTLACQGTTTAL
jgi:hypothetical protein